MTEMLRSWPCWLLVAALALCVGIAVASAGGTVEAQPSIVYYVDAASGNDTGDGTELNPWKTITHAVNTVPAGNESYPRVIAVLPTGTYDEANGEVFPIVLDEEWVFVFGTETVTCTGGVPDPAQDGKSRLLQPRPVTNADVVGNGTGALFRINASFASIFDFDMSNATCGVEATCGTFQVAGNRFSTETDYDIEYGVYVNIEEVDRATDFVFGGFGVDEEGMYIAANNFYVSSAGVYVNLDLDFDASVTGLSTTIGEFNVWGNDFHMQTTEGVSLNVTVADVNTGNVTIGSVEIGDVGTGYKGNHFDGGTYGVHFDGRLENLGNTTVIVDQIVVGNNDFYEQTDTAVLIDYYDSAHSGYASGWSGIMEMDFGPVTIQENGIDSAEPGCDGIVVNFGNWEYLEGDVSVVAQGIWIEGNELDDSVPGYGIHVHYGPLGQFSGSWPEVDVGGLDIRLNDVHTTSSSDGIYVHYDHCAYSLTEADVVFGAVDIWNNWVDAGLDGIRVYYDECGSQMSMGPVAGFGELDISLNDITAASDGVYVHYHNTHGLDLGAAVSWGAVTIEDNYAVHAGDNGIYLHYDNVGQDMWNGASVSIGDVSIVDNYDIAAVLDGVYVHYYRVGYYEFMSGAGVGVGALYIVWNDIGTEPSPVGDQGVEVYYNECGYYQENDSVVTFGDVTCDYNTVFAGKDGVLTQYTDFGYYLNDTAQTAMGSLTVEGNTINANLGNVTYSGVHVWWNGFGHDLYGNSSVTRGDVAIRANEITEGYSGIDLDHSGVGESVYDSAGVVLGNVEIDGNTIRDSDYTGLYLHELYGATVTDNLLLDNGHGIYLEDCDTTDIQHNDILRNEGVADSGVHFDANCGGNNTVNYNNIVANAGYGVFNDAGNEEVNAENNWWGNTSGPDDDASVINGTGDAISTNVDADPWLGQQSYVSPYQQTATATGAGNATIQTDGGAIVDFQAVAEDSLPEEGKPDGVEFPYGFFSFTVIGLELGQEVTVTLTLPGGNVTAGSLYWKHGPTLANPLDHWFSLPIGDNDGDEVITIDLTDGGDGDLDVTEDGEIVEPGGPGTSPYTPSPGFSMPSWGGVPIGTPTPTPQPQDGGNSTTPAEFNVSSLQISPAEVQPNEAVDVSFDVSNVGGSDGSYEAVLYVEEEAEGSQQVSVAAGETKGAFFAVSKAEPGDYQVSVGGQSGWFTVVGAQTAGGGGLGTWAIVGIAIAAVVVLGLAAFFVVRRLRPAV